MKQLFIKAVIIVSNEI